MSDEPTPLTYESPRWIALPAADLGALTLRFLALKMALDAIEQVPATLSLLLAPSPDVGSSRWIAYAIYVAWHLGVAIALVAFARPIAGVVFGSRNAAIADLGPASWMTLVVAGAGVTLAIFAAGDLITLVARAGFSLAFVQPHVVDIVLAPLLRIGVGLTLFFAPSLLVGPWVTRDAPHLDEGIDA